ncbi:hypothetical protein [Echinicola shivajiensis]|uniref:hypothetical protein n=1 Tax=Echinicola shivajiensis TaxID=1035916 RepID=UPI001BFCC40D|nr:hypothetical protein [Echinicola shivajiensis]
MIQNPDEKGQENSPWKSMLKRRDVCVIAMGKLRTDPIWWFYLTWLLDFFNSNDALDYNLDLRGLALPFIFIYFTSDL